MIPAQDIRIYNRQTLEEAREHLRKRSAFEVLEIKTHCNELVHKWTLQRIGYLLTRKLAVKSLGKGLGTVAASLLGPVIWQGHKKVTKGWKLMLVTALEKTLSSVIRRFV